MQRNADSSAHARLAGCTVDPTELSVRHCAQLYCAHAMELWPGNIVCSWMEQSLCSEAEVSSSLECESSANAVQGMEAAANLPKVRRRRSLPATVQVREPCLKSHAA